MDKDVVPFDLARMLLGDPPTLFMLEMVVRIIVIYLYALVAMQFMGKRGRNQMNPLEYLVIIALGSATGDVMFYPEVPLLNAMIVIGMIVLLGAVFAKLESFSKRISHLFESEPTWLVHEGHLLETNLHRESISKDELYSQLREAGVEHLGQVRAAILELSGRVSVFKYANDKARAGQSILPARKDHK